MDEDIHWYEWDSTERAWYYWTDVTPDKPLSEYRGPFKSLDEAQQDYSNLTYDN